MEFFVEGLLEHEEKEYGMFAALFKQVDVDGSDSVDFEEFKELAQTAPGLKSLTSYEISSMFSEAAGEDEELSCEEFVALAKGAMKNSLGKALLDDIHGSLLNQEASFQ